MHRIDFQAVFAASPNPYVLLDPSFVIADMNDAYLAATWRNRAELIGRRFFEAFPGDPDAPGHQQLQGSLERVRRDGITDHLPLIRYDIASPDGRLERRYWTATHSPLFDRDGNLIFILQNIVDVTELHELRESARTSDDPRNTQELGVFRRASAVQETNRALREEQRLFRDLFEQAPGFTAFLAGPDHEVAFANAAYLDLVGRRNIIGKAIGEALPEIAAQGFVRLLDEAYRTGQPFVGRDVRVVLASGTGDETTEHYLDFIYQPIAAADGTTLGIFVQGNDVTEQKHARDALRESEERFRLVADSAPVMLWMSDIHGNCIYLNRLQREFWKVAPDEITMFDWSSTLHPEDRERVGEVVGRAMAEHIPFNVEARFRRFDGDFRMLMAEARPRFGRGGQFVGMIGVNVDVTQSREIEAALRRNTASLEAVNRAAATLAADFNLDRIVQAVTDAGVTLIGARFGAFFYNDKTDGEDRYSLYALSGAPREAFEHLPMPRVTPLFKPTFNGDGVVRVDDVLADPRFGGLVGMPPGHVPVRSYIAIPVVSRSGDVLGALLFGHPDLGVFGAEHEQYLAGVAGHAAVAIDNARLFNAVERELQFRTEAEEQLRQLNETLEARVAAEITERRQAEAALQQAQKMDAVGKLTGGVAHDFNNLLQVISGNLQLLARDVAGNGRAERRVENALAGVDRGAKLASQLLAFGRRQPLEPRVVNVGRLIYGMEDMLRRTIGEAVEIETVVSAGLWNILVDPVQIENALLNLAINARDAMGGEGKLTIEAGNVRLDEAYARANADVTPGRYVMLAVSDTGSGIPPEIMEHVFEPFFSTKPESKGSGLGLSMVYGFVKQSGGHVKLYSEVDEGTTVKIYLPRSDRREDHVLGEANEADATGGVETVLVVEDDDGVRATVVDMLGELGYRVLKAKDAASALTVLESGAQIDVLFTDVVMPGPLKSTELARIVNERMPGVAVLFTSGYTENSIVHGGRLDEGVDLLSKPYTRSALARKLRQVLAARGRSA